MDISTNYFTFDPSTNTYPDLGSIFASGNSGLTTYFNTIVDGSNQDLGQLFSQNTTFSSIGFDTSYNLENDNDLRYIFAPKITYTITDISYITVTEITDPSYQAIIFDYNGEPYYPFNSYGTPQTPPLPGTCKISFNQNLNVNMCINIVIVGGGGGGGQSYGGTLETSYSGGCGGGGGGIIYQSLNNLILPMDTTFDIQVGYNGGGNLNPHPDTGKSTGGNGDNSYIQSLIYDISFTALGGQGGGGIGSTNKGGGSGGNSIYIISEYSTGIQNFGGGGGGGGGTKSSNPSSELGGEGGCYRWLNSHQSANFGENGQDFNQGGNGGSSYYYINNSTVTVTVPFTDISNNSNSTTNVYCGNAGGGGNEYGGMAGNTQGGLGNKNTPKTGQSAINGFSGNAFYYGNGGGGSANNDRYGGGNGANGVVMIWWNI
jgi:hypothetical protein